MPVPYAGSETILILSTLFLSLPQVRRSHCYLHLGLRNSFYIIKAVLPGASWLGHYIVMTNSMSMTFPCLDSWSLYYDDQQPQCLPCAGWTHSCTLYNFVSASPLAIWASLLLPFLGLVSVGCTLYTLPTLVFPSLNWCLLRLGSSIRTARSMCLATGQSVFSAPGWATRGGLTAVNAYSRATSLSL